MLNIKKLFKSADSEKSERKKLDKTLSKDSSQYKIKSLEIDLKYNKISEEDYEYAVAKINHHPDSLSYKLSILDLDKKYQKIDEFTYEDKKMLLTSNPETLEYKLNQIQLQLKYKKITDIEAEKQTATLNGEPWFKFLETKLEDENFSFKWDCNELFIQAIAKMGYNQPDPEENVLEWLKDGFMETYDQDYDMVQKDIENFEKSKIQMQTDSKNPNIKQFS